MVIKDKTPQFTRFPADSKDVAYLVFFKGDEPITISGLIMNESFTGCSVILLSKEDVPPGTEIVITVGKLPPTLSEVVWSRKVDQSIYRLGLKYKL